MIASESIKLVVNGDELTKLKYALQSRKGKAGARVKSTVS